MCLAIPGKVKKILGKEAVVEYGKEERKVLVSEKSIKTGDWVLVQMGMVVEKLTAKDARERLKVWNGLK